MVLSYLPVALGCLLYLFSTGGEYALVVRTVGEHPQRDVAIGLACGSVLVIASQLLAPRFAAGRQAIAAMVRIVGRPTGWVCAVMAASAAVGEELLFRAVLQEVFGVVSATALFVVIHLPLDRDLWPWTLAALPVGLVYAGAYAWTGAALAPMVAHAVLGFVTLRQLSRRAALAADDATGSAR